DVRLDADVPLPGAAEPLDAARFVETRLADLREGMASPGLVGAIAEQILRATVGALVALERSARRPLGAGVGRALGRLLDDVARLAAAARAARLLALVDLVHLHFVLHAERAERCAEHADVLAPRARTAGGGARDEAEEREPREPRAPSHAREDTSQ